MCGEYKYVQNIWRPALQNHRDLFHKIFITFCSFGLKEFGPWVILWHHYQAPWSSTLYRWRYTFLEYNSKEKLSRDTIFIPNCFTKFHSPPCVAIVISRSSWRTPFLIEIGQTYKTMTIKVQNCVFRIVKANGNNKFSKKCGFQRFIKYMRNPPTMKERSKFAIKYKEKIHHLRLLTSFRNPLYFKKIF